MKSTQKVFNFLVLSSLVLYLFAGSSAIAEPNSIDLASLSPPTDTLKVTEFLVAKQRFNSEARPKIQRFLQAVQNKLNDGQEIDESAMHSLFLNGGEGLKIRVTNHKNPFYDVYALDAYWQHLEGLKKDFKTVNIQFTVAEGPITTSPLNGYWIAQVSFTQEFKGLGKSNYCDQTEKFVKLYIHQDDPSYQIYLGDIWFTETMEVDCAQ